MPLILFGHQYAGKSLAGRYLAKRFNKTWIDTDRLVCAQYKDSTDTTLSCREIYQKHGQEFFRALEKRVIMEMSFTQTSIISLGGGSLIDPQVRSFLKARGFLLWIRCSKSLLKQRTLRNLPPFYSLEDFDRAFESRFQEREVIFKAIGAPSVFLKVL